jgi:hypothetical protein
MGLILDTAPLGLRAGAFSGNGNVAPPPRGEIEKGFNLGVGGVASGLQGSVATLQDALGYHDEALARYAAARLEAERMARENPLAVQNFTDINSLGDAGNWAAGALGQAVPSIATGIGGAVAGRLGLGAAAKFAKNRGSAAVSQALSNPTLNTAVGAGLGMLPQEMGESAMSLYGDPTAMANTTPVDRLGINLGKGVVNSALESIVPAYTIGKVVKPGVIKGGMGGAAAHVGKIAGIDAAGEFLTEGAQNVVGDLAHGVANPANKVDWKEAFNAGMAGAVGGAAMGGAGGIAGIAKDKLSKTPEPKVTKAVDDNRKWTQHSELDGLTTPQEAPRGLRKNGTDDELLAWQGQDDVARTQKAVKLAKDMVSDPAAPQDVKQASADFLTEAENGNAQAWAEYSAALGHRRDIVKTTEKVEDFASKVGELLAKGVKKVEGTKQSLMQNTTAKNYTPTEADLDFAQRLFSRDNMQGLDKKLDDKSKAMFAKYLRGYIESGFGAEHNDGEVVVPDQLSELLGEHTAKAITNAADILRRDHGFKMDKTYVERVKQVAEVVSGHATARKADKQIISDNLTSEAYDTLHASRLGDVAQMAKEQALGLGKHTDKLKALLGPNTDAVLQAFHDKYKRESPGTVDLGRQQVEDDEGVVHTGHEGESSVSEDKVTYHGRDAKKGGLYDMENPEHRDWHGKNLADIAARKGATTRSIGAADYLLNSGMKPEQAQAELEKLLGAPLPASAKERKPVLDALNKRYRGIEATVHAGEEADPLTITHDEMKSLRDGGDKKNRHIGLGRLTLVAKDGKEFHTSSQRLIQLMEKKTNADISATEQGGVEAKRRQFSAALASIMQSENFDHIRYTDKQGVTHDLAKGESLPKDFVLFNFGLGKSVTLGEAEQGRSDEQQAKKEAADERRRVLKERNSELNGYQVTRYPSKEAAAKKAAELSKAKDKDYVPVLGANGKWLVEQRRAAKRGYTDGVDTNNLADYTRAELTEEIGKATAGIANAQNEGHRAALESRLDKLNEELALRPDDEDSGPRRGDAQMSAVVTEDAAVVSGKKAYDATLAKLADVNEKLLTVKNIVERKTLRALRSDLNAQLRRMESEKEAGSISASDTANQRRPDLAKPFAQEFGDTAVQNAASGKTNTNTKSPYAGKATPSLDEGVVFSENAAEQQESQVHVRDEETKLDVQGKHSRNQQSATERIGTLKGIISTTEQRLAKGRELLAKAAPKSREAIIENGKRLAGVLAKAQRELAEVEENLKVLDKKPSATTNSAEVTVTPEVEAAIREYAERVLGPKFKVIIKDMAIAGEWSPKGAMRIATTAVDPYGVAHHESIHELFKRLRDHGDARTLEVLNNLSTNKIIRRKLEQLLAGHPEAIKQLSDPEEFAAYVYQFHAAGVLELGPKAEGLFAKIKNFIKGVLGVLTEDQKAEQILIAFNQGAANDMSFFGQAMNAMDSMNAEWGKVTTNLSGYVDKANAFLGSVEGRLVGNKNPHLDTLGRLFVNVVGEKGQQGHLQAVRQKIDQMDSGLKRAIERAYGPDEEIDPKDVEMAMEAMQKGITAPDRIARKIQDEIQGLKPGGMTSDGRKSFFLRMHEYLKDSGVSVWDNEKDAWVPVSYVENYFPRAWDTEKLASNGEQFIALLLQHHTKDLQGIADKVNAESKAAKPLTPEDIAHAILQRLTTSNGQNDLGETNSSMGFAPFMKAVNKRTLNFIDMRVFAEFQEKDFTHILSGYIRQAVKRAEYVKRFGLAGEVVESNMRQAHEWELNKDADGMGVKDLVGKAKSAYRFERDAAIKAGKKPPSEWQDLIPRIMKDNGVDDQGVSELTKRVNERMVSYAKAISAMEGTLGADASDLTKTVSSYMMAYQNWRNLGYVLFANIIDPMGTIINGGEVNDAFATLRAGLTSIVKGKDYKTDAIKLAEYVGTIDANHFHGMLGEMYGSQFTAKGAAWLNDKLFQFNGMEAYNRGVRAQATMVAKKFIEKHVTTPNQHSARYIEELYGENVKASDIKMKDGQLDITDDKNRVALMRWVDGAILRPTAAQRTTWGSDPLYQLFFQFKTFTYAMHRVILRRAYIEAQHGNYSPALTLVAGYVPVMIAADLFKGLVTNLGDEPEWMKGLGPAGVLSNGVQRAGLAGIYQFGLDAADNPLRAAGPMVGQIGDAFKDPLGLTGLKALPLSPQVRGAVD